MMKEYITANKRKYSTCKTAKRSLLVIPIGAYEQHGKHLPLATDEIIADILANSLISQYGGERTGIIPVSCSQEHANVGLTLFTDTLSIYNYIKSIIKSAFLMDFERVALINAHGGNYFLKNLTQEENYFGKRVYLGPSAKAMKDTFESACLETSVFSDMHAGEYETSILLAYRPELVRKDKIKDNICDEKRELLNSLGMEVYTKTGVIGRPSLATKEKGELIVHYLTKFIIEEMRQV